MLTESDFYHIPTTEERHSERYTVRENSNIVAIETSIESIWKAVEWSSITFSLSLNDFFLTSGETSEKSNFFLYAFVVNQGTREKIDYPSPLMKLKFDKHHVEGNDALAEIFKDPYSSVCVQVHRSLFCAGECFSLVIEAISIIDRMVYFGISRPIRVMEYGLVMESKFINNKHVEKGEGNKYTWYCKMGGRKSNFLEVTIHHKDSKNQGVQYLNEEIVLQTELIYENGNKFLNLDLKSSSAETHIYQPMPEFPKISPYSSWTAFSFRIEEVSFHHPWSMGFKIKVSTLQPSLVHPAILDETINVKSKPKTTFSEKISAKLTLRTVHLSDPLDENVITRLLDLSQDPSTGKGIISAVLSPELLDQVIRNNKSACTSCEQVILKEDFLFPQFHSENCKYRKLLSSLEFVRVSGSQSTSPCSKTPKQFNMGIESFSPPRKRAKKEKHDVKPKLETSGALSNAAELFSPPKKRAKKEKHDVKPKLETCQNSTSGALSNAAGPNQNLASKKMTIFCDLPCDPFHFESFTPDIPFSVSPMSGFEIEGFSFAVTEIGKNCRQNSPHGYEEPIKEQEIRIGETEDQNNPILSNKSYHIDTSLSPTNLNDFKISPASLTSFAWDDGNNISVSETMLEDDDLSII